MKNTLSVFEGENDVVVASQGSGWVENLSNGFQVNTVLLFIEFNADFRGELFDILLDEVRRDTEGLFVLDLNLLLVF